MMRILCAGMLVVILSSCGPGTNREISQPVDKLAQQWLAALENGQPILALDAATKIRKQATNIQTSPAYAPFVEREKLDPGYLTGGFNTWDYQEWADAYFLKQQAEKLVKGAEKPVEAIVFAVHDRIESIEHPETRHVHIPRKIWDRQWGVCDRQAWLASELLYQLGYETQIIYLRRDGTTVSPHTIAEIRLEEKVWTIDPLSRICLPGVSAEALASDRDLLESVWPDHETWYNAIQHCLMYTPGMTGDFCARNQQISSLIREQLGDQMPRFGEDPISRQQRYLKLRQQSDTEKLFPMMIWHFPVRMLVLDMELNPDPLQRKITP